MASAFCLVAAPAQASVWFAALPLTYSLPSITYCPLEPTIDAVALTQRPAYQSKASAIIGNQVSALDQIRLQQQGTAAAIPQAAEFGRPISRQCAPAEEQFAVAPAPAASNSPAFQTSSEFLGTARVAIGYTSFSSEWARVTEAGLSNISYANFISPSMEDDFSLASEINQWVNRNIEHVDDLTLYGQRDYWAAAEETLRLGQGDCEDFAILKYQLLAANGFNPDDMYMTLAYDMVRGADHALLIIRMADGFYMLDNSTDQLLPADQSYDYRATVSYSGAESWLHTASISNERETPRHLSVNATSSPREIGLNK